MLQRIELHFFFTKYSTYILKEMLQIYERAIMNSNIENVFGQYLV
jgi:hypothetical protein